MGSGQCSRMLRRLQSESLAECLNPKAQSSRLYRLTELGLWCRHRLMQEKGIKLHAYPQEHNTVLDWDVLGWVSFRHRAAVIRALTRPMQAVAIRRRARQQNTQLRMSANNVREVLRVLCQRDIAARVTMKDSIYPHFELTDLGKQLQAHMWQVEGLSAKC